MINKVLIQKDRIFLDCGVSLNPACGTLIPVYRLSLEVLGQNKHECTCILRDLLFVGPPGVCGPTAPIEGASTAPEAGPFP